MANDRVSIQYNEELKPLEAVLAGVKRTGDFVTHGRVELPMPRIEVEGAGVLSFPVPAAQAATLIQHAARAPFGRGEETILDLSVRKVWQLPRRPRAGRRQVVGCELRVHPDPSGGRPRLPACRRLRGALQAADRAPRRRPITTTRTAAKTTTKTRRTSTRRRRTTTTVRMTTTSRSSRSPTRGVTSTTGSTRRIERWHLASSRWTTASCCRKARSTTKNPTGSGSRKRRATRARASNARIIARRWSSGIAIATPTS